MKSGKKRPNYSGVVCFPVLIFALILPVTLLFGCSAPEEPANGQETTAPPPSATVDIQPVDEGTQPDETAPPDGKISVVCTVFPQYDWVREIVGERADNFELTLLLDSKVDLHNYQPTVDDIVKISTADLFIYVGGESDDWVDGALAQAINPDMIQINLIDVLGDGVKVEEIVEGMEDEDHEHDDHGEAPDEHVWLSLRNAQVFCDAITEALSMLDAAGADEYRNNAATYNGLLADLDVLYLDIVSGGRIKTILVADRFPFRYLVDDYGIDYYAAFAGCSAETEASFETIIFLAGKVDELGLLNVVVTESSDQSIAKTVIANSSTEELKQICVLDAMQSVSAGDIESGATYLTYMHDNMHTLEKVLS